MSRGFVSALTGKTAGERHANRVLTSCLPPCHLRRVEYRRRRGTRRTAHRDQLLRRQPRGIAAHRHLRRGVWRHDRSQRTSRRRSRMYIEQDHVDAGPDSREWRVDRHRTRTGKLAIDGNDASAIFNSTDTAGTLTLRDITVTNGHNPGKRGGCINHLGSVVLDGAAVTECTLDAYGSTGKYKPVFAGAGISANKVTLQNGANVSQNTLHRQDVYPGFVFGAGIAASYLYCTDSFVCGNINLAGQAAGEHVMAGGVGGGVSEQNLTKNKGIEISADRDALQRLAVGPALHCAGNDGAGEHREVGRLRRACKGGERGRGRKVAARVGAADDGQCVIRTETVNAQMHRSVRQSLQDEMPRRISGKRRRNSTVAGSYVTHPRRKTRPRAFTIDKHRVDRKYARGPAVQARNPLNICPPRARSSTQRRQVSTLAAFSTA